MEDILASIRRILNEEEAKPPPADDVFVLDSAMMLPDPEPLPAPPPDPDMANAVVAVPLPQETHIISEPPAMPEPLPVPFPPPPVSLAAPSGSMVAPEVAASAAASVGALMRTLASERTTAVHRGGPTIEDLVRDEIRPLMKEWLDQHLPPLVERLVRAEIERVVSRMT